MKNVATAHRAYTRCVARTLSHGTTTAAYFATIHVEATNLLADICLAKGQRAFIGKVCMDSSVNPQYYRDASAEDAVADTIHTIEHIKRIDPSREIVCPIITPRFAPSCTASLLKSLGELALREQLPIQTHISENPSECALVASLFPEHKSYAAVYNHHGLLTPRTVLAHAIHLSKEERALLKNRGCGISHCPVSNTSLSSGLCPVRTLLDDGVEVGLGTDVSGGYSSSILIAAREAGMVSRTLAAIEKTGTNGEAPRPTEAEIDRKKLTVEETLYLATQGGAKCLGLGDKVGTFALGNEWDAQLIEIEQVPAHDDSPGDMDDGADLGLVECWGNESWEEKVAKWIICGDDRNTRMVFVKGRLVHQR